MNTSDDYSAQQPGSMLANLAVRAAGRQRKLLYELFMGSGQVTAQDSILDIGVTSDERFATNNYLENVYPHKQQITAAGLAENSYLPDRFPGIKYVRIHADRPLPFADRTYDFVHASAVIEHAGSREQQKFFLQELWRVCRRGVFVTTPNRWFPVEAHTALPLLHWLPARTFRAALRMLGFTAWAEESQLNLMSASDLKKVAVQAGLASVRVEGVRLGGFVSNIALIATRVN